MGTKGNRETELELEARYIEQEGEQCPFCASHEIEAGNDESFGWRCYQEVSCLVCNARWYDLYRLCGIDILDHGKQSARS